MNKLVFASVISEIQQSDIFMTVKARICEAPEANLNGARVTEAFIDEVVGNKNRYVGLPLYADVRALTSGDYRRLGHLYDSKTGEFHSTQIGSFYQFEKESLDEGCALIGYARIAKRNRKLSKAISELFADGALKFSFEIAVGEYDELDDGTILIDASDSNYLEGTAIVTFPACEEAVALELVAQRKADDTEGGEKEMKKPELTAEEAVEQPVVAEEEKSEEVTEVADTAEEVVEQAEETEVDEETACKTKKQAEEEPEEEDETACKDKKAAEEVAAVHLTETHTEETRTYAYDTESGVDVSQAVMVTTTVSHCEPEAQIVEADDGIHIAEDAGGDEGDSGQGQNAQSETPTDPPAVTSEETPAQETTDDTVTPTPEENKKTAEQMIAELVSVIESLKNEIAELKEQKVVPQTVTAEINPLTADIRSEGKYTLLEKEEKSTKYSLLSK